MSKSPEKPSENQNFFSSILKGVEKTKVKLTPDIEEEVRAWLESCQSRAERGEPLTEADREFAENVRLWVGMPENIRKIFPSVESMLKEKPEAEQRNLSLRQWLDLLHVAEATGEKNKKEWINKTFGFPGNGKIEAGGSLHLRSCTGLTELPKGLKVRVNLDLTGCTGLTELPEGLEVRLHLFLGGCIGLTALPKGLKVWGGLHLNRCTGLTALPEEFVVWNELNLIGCTGLTALPKELKVGGYLYLSENAHKQVKKDAERLKKEGKIKHIQYL